MLHSTGALHVIEAIGIKGYVLLLQLLNFIPATFHSHRFQYMANILNVALSTTAFITPSEVNTLADLIHEAESTHPVVGTPPYDILWLATHTHGFPHTTFLGPPVEHCLMCSRKLQLHNKPTLAVCYTTLGPLPAAKVTLRCAACRTNYRYDQYGGGAEGYRYYDQPQPFVRASNTTYVERVCYAQWASL